MTAKAVERISGYQVRKAPPEGHKVAYAGYDGTVEIARGYGYTPNEALRRLLDLLYRRNGQTAMARDGWRCTECGSSKGLGTDHIQPRSKGRDDRPENLRSLCIDCHERRHLKSKEFNYASS